METAWTLLVYGLAIIVNVVAFAMVITLGIAVAFGIFLAYIGITDWWKDKERFKEKRNGG
jgi:hypothetical protein